MLLKIIILLVIWSIAFGVCMGELYLMECEALRNSPYVDEEVKNKSDIEIVELQERLEKEMD